jgi:hypothetical protein
MADAEWKTLTPLWSSPGESTDVGGFIPLAFTQGGASIWKVRQRAAAGSPHDDLVASGGVEIFEAAASLADRISSQILRFRSRSRDIRRLHGALTAARIRDRTWVWAKRR